MIETWDQAWQRNSAEALERQPYYDPDDYYCSGRASAKNPNKEDPAWWAANGPKFITTWEHWRRASGLRITEFPGPGGEALPGIELEVWAERPADRYPLAIKSVIDRVFTDQDGALRIVDLKTGSHTDAWPLQMALNNLGLAATFGEEYRARWAGFWKARAGGVLNWFDLSIYDDEWLWEMVWKAREIRDQQLFLPNPNNLCTSACGVRKWCKAMGGSEPLFLADTQL